MANKYKALLVMVIVGALALIFLGQLGDQAFYYTSAAKTGNITGVSAVVISFVGVLFVIAIILHIIGWF